MSGCRVAVLGGDARDAHIAERLAEAGHAAVRYGQPPAQANGVQVASSASDAVRGAEWVICPSPGLNGDKLFAPAAPEPIHLDAVLLEQSAAQRGGVILGRSTPELDATAARLGISLFQLKDDLGLATRLSTGVAEGVIRVLIEQTRRILRDHRILVVGYGVTGAVIVDYLVGMRCAPLVTTRHRKALERARQCGGSPVPFDERLDAMGEVDIVINTAPSTGAVPAEAFARLAGRMVVDIASPPGGLDHDAARAAGVDVHWLRGLAGGRAPLTAGDAQYAFISAVIGAHSNGAAATVGATTPGEEA